MDLIIRLDRIGGVAQQAHGSVHPMSRLHSDHRQFWMKKLDRFESYRDLPRFQIDHYPGGLKIGCSNDFVVVGFGQHALCRISSANVQQLPSLSVERRYW